MTDSGPAWSIDWTRHAEADVTQLTKRGSERIKRAINRFAETGYGDVHPLRGSDLPQYRLKAGDWRLLFRREEGVVRVQRVLYRREAYRKSPWIHQAVPGPEGVHDYDTLENPGHLIDEESGSH